MELENGTKNWGFQGNEELHASAVSVRGVYNKLAANLDKEDKRPVHLLCRADPTNYSCFRTTPVAAEAVASAVQSFKFNCYPPTAGLLEARRAIAELVSSDLPFRLSPDDVYITVGCTQAINVILTVLARPGANILLPRPYYPHYKSRAACCRLEVRHFDLLPDKGWEIDLNSLEAVADENTVAMVIINPCNPCGNAYTYQHLQRVAETAKKLGIFVIADEVYANLTYASHPYVRMGQFASIVPVITLGSLSKRWIVPGWRLGWIVTCDPNDIFQKTRLVANMKSYLDLTCDAPTFTQAAIPDILEKTKDDFFSHNLSIMREAANIFYERCKEIPCLICPHKPEGTMTVMVQINFSQIEGITDDVDFCVKLTKEESVILLPGVAVGMKNWIRVSYVADPSDLEDALSRIKAFSLRHMPKHHNASVLNDQSGH